MSYAYFNLFTRKTHTVLDNRLRGTTGNERLEYDIGHVGELYVCFQGLFVFCLVFMFIREFIKWRLCLSIVLCVKS